MPSFVPMQYMAPMPARSQPMMSRSPAPSLSRMNARDVDELNQWFEAKDQKNFGIADGIRAGLRARGIEPDQCQRPGGAGLDDAMEDELRQWFDARDSKDYAVADRIREGLRAKGVEPSQCQRPE